MSSMYKARKYSDRCFAFRVKVCRLNPSLARVLEMEERASWMPSFSRASWISRRDIVGLAVTRQVRRAPASPVTAGFFPLFRLGSKDSSFSICLRYRLTVLLETMLSKATCLTERRRTKTWRTIRSLKSGSNGLGICGRKKPKNEKKEKNRKKDQKEEGKKKGRKKGRRKEGSGRVWVSEWKKEVIHVKKTRDTLSSNFPFFLSSRWHWKKIEEQEEEEGRRRGRKGREEEPKEEEKRKRKRKRREKKERKEKKKEKKEDKKKKRKKKWKRIGFLDSSACQTAPSWRTMRWK